MWSLQAFNLAKYTSYHLDGSMSVHSAVKIKVISLELTFEKREFFKVNLY